MKKLLSLFASLMLTCVFAAATTLDLWVSGDGSTASTAENTYEFAIGELSSVEAQGFQLAFVTGGSNATAAFAKDQYNAVPHVRAYAGNSLTVSVPDGTTMTKIEWKIQANSKGAPTASEGTITGEGTTSGSLVTWAGSINGGTLTLNFVKQMRFSHMVITYEAGEAPAVAKPRLNLASQEYFEPITINVTNGYAEGVVVRYTTDGSDVTAESDVFPATGLVLDGVTVTLKVKAFSGEDESEQVEATYTYSEPENMVTRLADITTVGTEYYYNGNAVVVAHPAGDTRYVYIQDASGAHVLYATTLPAELKQGDVLAPFTATLSEYKGLKELTSPTGIDVVDEDADVDIPVFYNTAPTVAADMNKIVLFNGVVPTADVTLTTSSNSTTFSVIMDAEDPDHTTLNFRNSYKIAATMSASSQNGYDILAAVSVYNTLQIVPLEVTERTSPATALEMIQNNGIRYFNGMVYNQDRVRMQIFSVQGHKVADTTEDFDMSGLANGVYMIRANNAVLKVVK